MSEKERKPAQSEMGLRPAQGTEPFARAAFRGESFTQRIGELPPMEAETVGADPPGVRRVALVGVHGMGEQLRYDTIDQYTSILAEELSAEGRLLAPVSCQLANLNGQEHVRAVLQYTDTDGKPSEMHVLEAYWSPLGKGLVQVKDSMDFLFDAGKRGIKFACATRRKDRARFAFNRWFFFAHEYWMVWLFAFILAVLASLGFLNSVLALQTGYQLAGGNAFTVQNGMCREAVAVLPFFVCVLLLLLAMWGDSVSQAKASRGAFEAWRSDPKTRLSGAAPTRRWSWFWIYAALTSLIFGAVLIALSRTKFGWVEWLFGLVLPDLPYGGVWNVVFVAGVLFVLGVLAYALRFANHWLVWYVGDLVVYFCATRPTKFSAARTAIRDAVHGVLHDVYAAKTADGKEFVYDEVIVAAHSLGTVVAYEALNDLIADDTTLAAGLDAANRTRLFLTSGSPLDKYAYIFRYQQTATNPYREGTAQATQPMLTNYAQRPREWVNIWSRQDPISGDLGFYDPPAGPDGPNPKAIQNLEDPFASVPFAAHGEYFGNPLIRQVLMGRV